MSPEYQSPARIFIENHQGNAQITTSGWDFQVSVGDSFTVQGDSVLSNLIFYVGGAKIRV